MSVRPEPAEPVAYRRMAGPATLVFGDDPARRAMLGDLAAALGGRIEADRPLADAVPALERQPGTAVLVLDLAQDDGDALDRLLDAVQAGAAAARFVVVAVVRASLIDTVFARIDDPNIAIAFDGDEPGIAAAFARTLRPRVPVLTEPGRDDATRRLAELGEETARIARAIAALSESIGRRVEDDRDIAEAASDPQTALATTRWLLRTRRLRERFFDAALFADPAWDILLDLHVAWLEGRRVAVSSLCIAAAVPPTTALRWIATMTDRGLLARGNDPADRRRSFLSLTPTSAAAMSDYVTLVAPQVMPTAR